MTPFLDDGDVQLYHADAIDLLRALPSGSADCVVTSPPYLNTRPEYPSPTLDQFAAIFRELRRVAPGPALVNVGRLFRDHAESLWWVKLIEAASPAYQLLDTIIWVKPNGNPIHGTVLANRHEYVLVLGQPGDYFNVDGVRVPYAASSVARLRRGWRAHVGVKGDASRKSPRSSEPHPEGGRPPSYIIVDTGREKGNAHPAPMAEGLALELVTLASKPGYVVLDPFVGSGTTAIATRRLGRSCIGFDLSADYLAIAARRLQQLSLLGGDS